jgi:hypothetical protein
MGHYNYFRPKQKNPKTIEREKLLSRSSKIISLTKLESLGKKELENQKKIYEKENPKLNELLKQYENEVEEYRRFENLLINNEKEILTEYHKLKSTFKIKQKKYYVLKDLLLFNKIIRKFIFNLYVFDLSVINKVIKKKKEFIRLLKSEKLTNFYNYYDSFEKTVDDLFLIHKIDCGTPGLFGSLYWNDPDWPKIGLPTILLNYDFYPRSFEEILEKGDFRHSLNGSDSYYSLKKLTEVDSKFFDKKDSIIINTTIKDFFKYFSIDDEIIKLNGDLIARAEITEAKFYEEKFLIIKEFNNRVLRKIELLLRSKAKQKEKLENVGYVYVLSNEAYPGVYKIGSTYGLVEERAEELTGTGHLHPFVPEFSIKIESAEYFEKTTHSLFKEYRVKQGREFFKMELKIIKTALKQIKTITNEGKIKFKTGELKKKIGL